MKELLSIIVVGFLLMTGTITAAVCAVEYLVERPQCSASANKMGFESNWSLATDCMIKVDGRWVPIDAYKVVKQARG